MTNKTILILFFITNCLYVNLFAQINLQQKISINSKNQTLKTVLQDISKQTNINFSYNNQQINDQQNVYLIAKNQTVESIINSICNNLNLNFTIVEKQIILQPKIILPEKNENNFSQKTETFILSGYIKDIENEEALIGAIIHVLDTKYAITTNSYGFYSLSLPKGNYVVEFSYLGYDKKVESIDLQKNTTFSTSLKMNIQELKIILITDTENSKKINKNSFNRQTINSNSVYKHTVLAGEPDVIKSLQSVTGLNFYSEGSIIFNVRGGDKGQNAIFLDEAPIFNPSHLFGFFSSIAPESINSLNIYKSDFPIQYSERLSSIIDIKTKEGNLKKFTAGAYFSPLASSYSISSPIVKEKASFIITFRRSHLNYLFKNFIPDLNIKFYDFHTKINFKTDRKNRFFLAFYTGGDDLVINNSGLEWKNSTFTFRWNHLFSDKIFSNTTLYSSSYKYYLHYSISQNINWESKINSFALKNDFTYYLNSQNTIYFGYETKFHSFNPGNLNYNEYFIRAVFASNVINNSLYLGGEFRTNNNFFLKYGLRFLNWNNFGPTVVFDYNENYQVVDTNTYGLKNYNSYNYFEPRISLYKYFNDKLSFSLNYNRNVQFLHYISNSISPFTTLDIWLPANTNLKPQTSHQLSSGIIFEFKSIELSSEFYYKIMKNQLDFTNQPNVFLNPFIEGQLRFGETTSYGAEFSIKKQKGIFTYIINYSYSRTFRKTKNVNFDKTYPAIWDKPHNFYSTFSIDLNYRTKLTINFVYSSGNRYSSPTGFYNYQNINIPIYENKNNDKLPDYHRLDASIQWQLNKNPNNTFAHYLTFSIYNLYARKNVVAINYNKIENTSGQFEIPANYITENELVPTATTLLGFIPSLSYRFNFK